MVKVMSVGMNWLKTVQNDALLQSISPITSRVWCSSGRSLNKTDRQTDKTRHCCCCSVAEAFALQGRYAAQVGARRHVTCKIIRPTPSKQTVATCFKQHVHACGRITELWREAKHRNYIYADTPSANVNSAILTPFPRAGLSLTAAESERALPYLHVLTDPTEGTRSSRNCLPFRTREFW